MIRNRNLFSVLLIAAIIIFFDSKAATAFNAFRGVVVGYRSSGPCVSHCKRISGLFSTDHSDRNDQPLAKRRTGGRAGGRYSKPKKNRSDAEERMEEVNGTNKNSPTQRCFKYATRTKRSLLLFYLPLSCSVVRFQFVFIWRCHELQHQSRTENQQLSKGLRVDFQLEQQEQKKYLANNERLYRTNFQEWADEHDKWLKEQNDDMEKYRRQSDAVLAFLYAAGFVFVMKIFYLLGIFNL